jgi:cephalosporin hydroxylase
MSILSTLHGIKNRLLGSLGWHKFIMWQFHRFYYSAPAWRNTTWLGVPTLKCPLDLWVYQEILYKEKPDIIVECGTSSGGSALYMASMCDILNHGKIISIDIAAQPHLPTHPRITYVSGSSTDPEIVSRVHREAVGKKVLVILDSDHSKAHVLGELEAYHDMVYAGGYLIVEDTNIGGHPVWRSFGAGPMEAVHDFIKKHPEFSVDKTKEKFYLTFNPNGYLQKNR